MNVYDCLYLKILYIISFNYYLFIYLGIGDSIYLLLQNL